MRTEAETIDKLRSYAEAVLLTLDAEGPTEPGVEELFQRIRHKAEQTIERANSPLKIGIVGDFAAGKTLLLGALIGYADALPVSELPTTGNVTQLRFRPSAELEQTSVGPYRVEFLNRRAALDCLGELLRVLADRSRMAGLDKKALQQLDSIGARRESAPWGEIEEWCRAAWPHGGGNPNPALRNLLREVTWFVRCCASPSGSAFLDAANLRDRILDVPEPVVREGLRLELPDTPVTSMRFEDLRAMPKTVATASQITAPLMRELFPLIYRIEVDVQLPRSVWNLSDLQGAGEFTLLDFPGLGVADSGVRDEYLCKRELREVQTILVLLDGRNPGGTAGPQLFDIMQKDRPEEDLRDNILVGVNRFDQLPLQNDGGEAVLSRLVATDELGAPTSVSDEDVLSQLPLLRKAANDARTLTPKRDDRVVLLSALGALRDLRENTPANIRVGSPEFEGNLTGGAEASVRRPKWQRLAQMLSSSNPRSPLARWLGDYSRDCGIGRLRQLIVEHVAQHGLQQMYRYVKESAQELHEAIESLPDRRTESMNPESLSAGDLQRIIDELYSVYTAIKTEHEQSAPELTVSHDGQRLPMQQRIYDQVTQSVADWEVWNELLNRIDKEGIIREVEVSDDPWGDDDEDDGELPADSRWFLHPFESTAEENHRFAAHCIEEGVKNQFSALAERTQSCREMLSKLVKSPAVLERVQQLHEKIKAEKGKSPIQRQWSVLVWASDPSNEEVSQRFLDGYARKGDEAFEPRGSFPLAGAEVDRPAQHFPWANGHGQNGGSHQVLILRLRDALADGMRRCVLKQVSQMNKQVLNGFLNTFTHWIEGLLRLGGNWPLLTYITGEESSVFDGSGWQVASIPYPLTESAQS